MMYHAPKTWIVRFNEELLCARKQQRLRQARELQVQAALSEQNAQDEMA